MADCTIAACCLLQARYIEMLGGEKLWYVAAPVHEPEERRVMADEFNKCFNFCNLLSCYRRFFVAPPMKMVIAAATYVIADCCLGELLAALATAECCSRCLLLAAGARLLRREDRAVLRLAWSL